MRIQPLCLAVLALAPAACGRSGLDEGGDGGPAEAGARNERAQAGGDGMEAGRGAGGASTGAAPGRGGWAPFGGRPPVTGGSPALGGVGPGGGTAGGGGGPTTGGGLPLGGAGGTATGGALPIGGLGGGAVTGGAPPLGGAGGTATGGGGSGTGGIGGACGDERDCDDGDPCTLDRCDRGVCVWGPMDADGDGSPSLLCGGQDCNDLNPNVVPGAAEVCADGADNDCNGLSDCLDPACASVVACGCVATPERCEGGIDEDCDGAVDCLDPSCDSSPSCGCLGDEAGRCGNGADDDCDGAVDCADPDCDAEARCHCAAYEQCDNDVDDDCDGLIDCADPTCAWVYPCVCTPPGAPETCTNSADDDCDGWSDCADPDCLMNPACAACTAEICDDGLDNDCDGAIDCADSGCFLTAACPVAPEQCNNSRDDDFDGRIDCDDPDCINAPTCSEAHGSCLTADLVTASGTWTGVTTDQLSTARGSCGGDAGEDVFRLSIYAPSRVELDTFDSDFDVVLYVRAGSCELGRELGCDDDSAGSWDGRLAFDLLPPGEYFVFVDGLMVDPSWGPDEGRYVLNVDIETNPPELCTSGVDDDGDELADCADPDCSTVEPCATCRGGLPGQPELGPDACTDGVDNDCDGDVDCADRDCSASDTYTNECCTGTDENGNGIPDDFNCRCIDDGDCPLDQLCYHHTIRACGIPCDSYIGDVCPSEAPGSYCSGVTRQCEF